jgi:MFS transporter, SP family, galactose:H+ symporter
MSASAGETGGLRSRKLLAWAMAAALGSFVMGYQFGVISGALLFIRRDFGLSNFEQGALVGVLPLGALVGGLAAGRLADSLGRRRTLLLDAIVLIVAIAVTVAAPSYGVLLAGRAIVGFGVGATASTVPLYLSEIAPPQIRGRLVTLHQLMITLGILISFCVDLAFSGGGSWRWMLAVDMLPAVALAAGMLRSPESPAWLYERGQAELAKQVAREVADDGAAERLLEDLGRSRAGPESEVAPWRLLRSPARPALIVGVTLAAALQLCGINAIISYGPSILEKTGLSASNSILFSLAIGVVNVASTIVSIRLVDRAGRRPLLLGSLAGMFVSLILLGLVFVLPLGAADSWLALACILAFVTAFAVGMGPVFWVLIAELFPLEARASGASLATAANWFFNVIVGLTFLPVATAIGEGQTFWLFAGVCALAFAFTRRYVPETKGRGFSEIGAELRERWGRERTTTAPAYQR